MGSSKGTERPQGIWLWRPVWFDYRTSKDWENRLLEGTNKTLCVPGARKKKPYPHKRLSQTCLWVSWSLWWRHGLTVACCRVRGTEHSACTCHFERGCCYLHYSYHSLVSGQTTGRENSPIHQQKLDYRFTEHGPDHQNKTQFPPQSVSPIRMVP